MPVLAASLPGVLSLDSGTLKQYTSASQKPGIEGTWAGLLAQVPCTDALAWVNLDTHWKYRLLGGPNIAVPPLPRLARLPWAPCVHVRVGSLEAYSLALQLRRHVARLVLELKASVLRVLPLGWEAAWVGWVDRLVINNRMGLAGVDGELAAMGRAAVLPVRIVIVLGGCDDAWSSAWRHPALRVVHTEGVIRIRGSYPAEPALASCLQKVVDSHGTPLTRKVQWWRRDHCLYRAALASRPAAMQLHASLHSVCSPGWARLVWLTALWLAVTGRRMPYAVVRLLELHLHECRRLC